MADLRNWSRRKIMSRLLRTAARAPRPLLAGRLLDLAARLRRAELTEELLRALGPTVHSGPFAGMRLGTEASWGDGDLAPKLLGCYEGELHGAIATAVSRRPTTIVNVGCAEGYYAVGLARLLPSARVHAFDTDERAQELCRRAALANGVADQLEVAGLCTGERLRALVAEPERVLVVLDCEGAELALLTQALIAAMVRCDVIVECHDFLTRDATATLMERFRSTHRVDRIVEGARDPNQFHVLEKWAGLERWLAVCEFRPETMTWLACWSH